VDISISIDACHGRFRCFVSSMPASLKSLSMPADDTGTLNTIFAQIFSLPSLLNFQEPVGSLIGIRLSRNSLISVNRGVLVMLQFKFNYVKISTDRPISIRQPMSDIHT